MTNKPESYVKPNYSDMDNKYQLERFTRRMKKKGKIEEIETSKYNRQYRQVLKPLHKIYDRIFSIKNNKIRNEINSSKDLINKAEDKLKEMDDKLDNAEKYRNEFSESKFDNYIYNLHSKREELKEKINKLKYSMELVLKEEENEYEKEYQNILDKKEHDEYTNFLKKKADLEETKFIRKLGYFVLTKDEKGELPDLTFRELYIIDPKNIESNLTNYYNFSSDIAIDVVDNMDQMFDKKISEILKEGTKEEEWRKIAIPWMEERRFNIGET